MPEPLTARRAHIEATSPRQADSQELHLSRFVSVLLGVLLLGLSFSRLVYPFDTGRYEAFIWSPARLAISGQNPYGFALSPPFVMAPYGIVYYMLIGLGMKLFGLQLWFGRLAAIVAAAICVACIWHITASLTKEREAPWFGIMAFMASVPLQSWVAIQRSDLVSLALAFVAVTVTFTTKWDVNRRAARIALVILLLVVAFFTKQTTLLPVATVVARFWQLRERRLAVIVLTGFAALSLAMMLWLNHSSDGGYLWQHWTHARRLPFNFERALRSLLALSKVPATWLLIGTCVFALYQARADLRQALSHLRNFSAGNLLAPSRSSKWLLVLYLLLAFLFGFMASGRHGSNINYYLESSIVASIVFALALRRMKERSKWQWAAKTILLLLAASSGWQLIRFARGEYFRWRSLPYFMEIAETVERSTPTDSVCISVFPELVTRGGRTFHFDDYGEYNDGLSPELRQALLDGISAKRYAAILWHDNEAKFRGYKLVRMKEPVPAKFYSVYLYLREP